MGHYTIKILLCVLPSGRYTEEQFASINATDDEVLRDGE